MRLPDQHDLGTLDTPDRRLDRVVVGVDFTESSLAVAQWVGRHLAPAAELLRSWGLAQLADRLAAR